PRRSASTTQEGSGLGSCAATNELLAGDSLSEVMRDLASGSDGLLAGLWRARIVQQFRDTYAGIPISKFPEDLRTYEQIIWERAPQVVIEVGVQHGGSTLWLRDRLSDLQRYRSGPAPQVVGVDVDLGHARRNFSDLPGEATAGIALIEGDIAQPSVVEEVLSAVPRDAEVFVIEDAQHDAATTLAALRALAPLIRTNGYYMVEDTCVDYEPLRLAEEWPRGCGAAVAQWLAEDPLGRRFERRPDLQAYGLTCHPGGLLRRVSDR
ncbi:MAG: CmcI family methyltransferase, partial [Solirubrobacteraceae bacterium]